jgi:hypothetical protein
VPTVGWIQEGSIERFLAGTTGVPDPGPAPLPVHECPFCRSHFESFGQLGSHLAAFHVGLRPLLTFGGREPASNEVIRANLNADAVRVLNCTAIQLSTDGMRFTRCELEEIGRVLAGGKGRIWVQLVNRFEPAAAPILQCYDLEFRVATEEQLRRVDETFVNQLARPDPTIDDVDRFLQSEPALEALEYAAGLADYVLGVLVKDGDSNAGVRRGLRDYRPKLNKSLRVLQSYDRPLSNLISSLIRFSSNDFSRANIETTYEPLDRANAFLTPLAARERSVSSSRLRQAKRPQEGAVGVCPIDTGSDSVMRRADHLSSMPRWTDQTQNLLRTEIALPDLDPMDRVKLCALWGARALQLNHPEAAIEPIRELVGNDPFGLWAEDALRRIDP